MRISDWSSDVCSSDLTVKLSPQPQLPLALGLLKTKPAAKSSSTQSMVDPRSEERRVGKVCVSTCRSRWSLYHSKYNVLPTHTLPSYCNSQSIHIHLYLSL